MNITYHIFKPIIEDLTDVDLYKFPMWQTLFHAYPANQAVYRFICRNTPAFPLAELKDQLEAQLDHLCSLRFTEENLATLAERTFLKSDFIDFLRIFQFQRRYISVTTMGNDLCVEARGPQIHTMGFELYVLAIVNELYFRRISFGREAEILAEGRRRLRAKIDLLKAAKSSISAKKHPFEFFDFSMRRRYSHEWQAEVVQTLAAEVPEYFKGTSNVALAKKNGLIPFGTMAHEYLQTFQAVGVALSGFQKAALEAWVNEFRGQVAIALTDVVGAEAFFRDFDLYFAKLFDGVRHDSGNPFWWGDLALAAYARLKIDANTKRLVFSDGLDIPKALELHQYFGDSVQTGFGIGTNLGNDMGDGDLKPIHIVMKLVECNGKPVAKLPDSEGKTHCEDPLFLSYLRQVTRV